MSNVEKIQLFLTGKLNPKETVAFQKKVQEDTEFKKELEDYQNISQGLKYIKRENFETQVREWNKSLPILDAPKEKTFSIIPLLKKAIAALVVIGLFALLYQTFQGKPSLEEFTQQQYVALALETNRSQSTSSLKSYSIAELSFGQKDYSACIARLNTIEATDTFYLKALLLKQHAFYQSQKHQEAIQAFTTIQSIKTPENYLEFDKDNAAWTALLSQVVLYQNTPTAENKAQLLQKSKDFLKENSEETYRARAMKLKALLE